MRSLLQFELGFQFRIALVKSRADEKPVDRAKSMGVSFLSLVAGWSSRVARQAHNLKVAGSNPAPAPNFKNPLSQRLKGFFLVGIGHFGTRQLSKYCPF
jgi:hypothetical protein